MKKRNLIYLLFLIMLIISFPKESSAFLAIGPSRAAIGQEIYNWVHVENEPVQRLEYYVDGQLFFSRDWIINTRYNFDHKFYTIGSHNFRADIYYTGGGSDTRTWSTDIYVPTKDLQGAINYAETWALTPNTNFKYFEGGDCTNFISQILNVGGNFPEEHNSIPGTTNWYYDGPEYGNTVIRGPRLLNFIAI